MLAATNTASSPSSPAPAPNVLTAADVITVPSPVTAMLLTWCRTLTGPSTPKATLPLAHVPVTVVSSVASKAAGPADTTIRNIRYTARNNPVLATPTAANRTNCRDTPLVRILASCGAIVVIGTQCYLRLYRSRVVAVSLLCRSTLGVVSVPPVAVVISFIDRVNHGDVAGLGLLMTDDHELRVLDETPVTGRDANIAAWRGYADAFPNYVIHPWRIAEADGRVAVLGHTTGSHLGLPDEEERRLAVIWSADVAGDRVRVWRVLDDSPELRRELGLDAT